MRQLLPVFLFVTLTLTACNTVDKTWPSTSTELRVGLTPVAFGDEQTMMAGIRSGIPFEKADGGTGYRGTIEVRGLALAVLRDDWESGPRVAVDVNRNAEFESEEFRVGDRTEHMVPVGDEVVVVSIENQETTSEYSTRELWRASFEHDGELLELGALQFGAGGIRFADNDLDGVFETFVVQDSPIWLAGRAWDLELDFGSRSARLVPVDRTPVTAGFEAPRVEARALGNNDVVPLVVDGRTTVLLFCHSGCAGCKVLAGPITDLRGEYTGDEAVRFLSVGRTFEQAAANQSVICPTYEHVVSDEAWSAYAVRPTPTLVVVDAEGMITYRGIGAGERSGTVLKQQIEAARK